MAAAARENRALRLRARAVAPLAPVRRAHRLHALAGPGGAPHHRAAAQHAHRPQALRGAAQGRQGRQKRFWRGKRRRRRRRGGGVRAARKKFPHIRCVFGDDRGVRRLRRRRGKTPLRARGTPRERRRRRGRREARRRRGAVRGSSKRAAPRPDGGPRRRPEAFGGARPGGRGGREAHGQARGSRDRGGGGGAPRGAGLRRAGGMLRAKKKKRPTRWMEPRERRGRHASPKKTLPRGGHSCAAKPRSRRARSWTAPRWFSVWKPRRVGQTLRLVRNPTFRSLSRRERKTQRRLPRRVSRRKTRPLFFSSDVSAATGAAADAETALMELLLAEARDDMKAATETATEALTEADVDAVVDAVAAETESPETSETRVDIVSSAAAASAAAALLGRRAGTAPGGARATPEGRRVVSASFEWPPPALTSERQAMKDAALERRVRAKLRTFLREELGAGDVSSAGTETRGLNTLLVRPATAVGTRDASSSVCEDALLASASSLDASDASYGSDDFENSGDFEAFFEGGEDARRAFRESRVE
mmetsp:Transcript_12302/g.52839  ORF Transcript_12302/g.52839 Transcript_12302/m.52839 type:complete len:535 (+) Transcript_12302:991-2595(+)